MKRNTTISGWKSYPWSFWLYLWS